MGWLDESAGGAKTWQQAGAKINQSSVFKMRRSFRPMSFAEHAAAATRLSRLSDRTGSGSLPDLRDMAAVKEEEERQEKEKKRMAEEAISAMRRKPSSPERPRSAEENSWQRASRMVLIGRPSFLDESGSESDIEQAEGISNCDLQSELKTLRKTIKAARASLHMSTVEARGVQAVLAEQRNNALGSPKSPRRREGGRWESRPQMVAMVAARDSRLLSQISSHGSTDSSAYDSDYEQRMKDYAPVSVESEEERHEKAMRKLRGTLKGLAHTSGALLTCSNRKMGDYHIEESERRPSSANRRPSSASSAKPSSTKYTKEEVQAKAERKIRRKSRVREEKHRVPRSRASKRTELSMAKAAERTRKPSSAPTWGAPPPKVRPGSSKQLLSSTTG